MTGLELLAIWGIGQTATEFVKGVLGDVAKDFAKNNVKSFAGRLLNIEKLKAYGSALLDPDNDEAYELALRESAFVKSYGKVVKVLAEVIEKELVSAGVPVHQAIEWIGDVQQFVRTEIITTAFANALSSSTGTIQGTDLERGWQPFAASAPLPNEFDWDFVAKTFNRELRTLRTNDADLRTILHVQAATETAENTLRLAGIPPEFNLEGYRESLLEYHGNLKLELLDATGSSYRVGLWKVFVPQTVRNCDGYVPQLLEIPKEVQNKLRQQGEWDDTSHRLTEEMLSERRQPYVDQSPRPVLEVVKDNRNGNLVILGDPGSGKSTLLKALALEWARIENHNERQQGTLPLLIELGSYDRWECPNAKSFVRYLQDARTVHRLDQFRLHERLKQTGGAILLLDGLDEIFDPNRRKDAINDIHRFSKDYPNTRIILTSRIIGYDQRQLADAGFRHFMLQDLDEAQIHEFLAHWYSTFVSDARERTLKHERLRRAITESPAIRELAQNPLLLTMMAIMNLSEEVPPDRVGLYENATKILLHRWEFERLGLKEVIHYRDKVEMLRRLAFHMQNAPEGLRGNIIDGVTLHQIFQEYLEERKLPNAYNAANELVEQLRRRNFILCHLGADKYAFVHRTLLEYFCARALVGKAQANQPSDVYLRDQVFAKHWHDESWHEVLRLIAGMEDQVLVQHVVLLINFLLEQEDKYKELHFHHVFLAAQCYQEVRSPKLIPNIRIRLFAALTELLQVDLPWWNSLDRQKLNAIRSKTVSVMAQAQVPDNPAAWLKNQVILDSNFIVKQAAIQELARGWKDDPDTLPWLKTIATQFEYSAQRQIAVEELAHGWKNDPDTLPWLKTIATQDSHSNVRGAAVREIARGWKHDGDILAMLKTYVVQDDEWVVRQAAVEGLARDWKDDPDTLPLLKICATQDGSPTTESLDYKIGFYVRDTAMRAIACDWPDDPATLRLLRERAANDPTPWLREWAKKMADKIEAKGKTNAHKPSFF